MIHLTGAAQKEDEFRTVGRQRGKRRNLPTGTVSVEALQRAALARALTASDLKTLDDPHELVHRVAEARCAHSAMLPVIVPSAAVRAERQCDRPARSQHLLVRVSLFRHKCPHCRSRVRVVAELLSELSRIEAGAPALALTSHAYPRPCQLTCPCPCPCPYPYPRTGRQELSLTSPQSTTHSCAQLLAALCSP